MQKKTRMIAVAAAASLLTLGGLVGLASADMGEGMMGRGHGMMGRHLMERYDADKDGKVTQAWPDRYFVPGRMRDYCMFDVPSRVSGGTMVTGAGGRYPRAECGRRVL